MFVTDYEDFALTVEKFSKGSKAIIFNKEDDEFKFGKVIASKHRSENPEAYDSMIDVVDSFFNNHTKYDYAAEFVTDNDIVSVLVEVN